MKGSLDIGRLFGIPVRLHWTFVLVLYGLLLISQSPGQILLLILALGSAVLLHELGHCLMARHFGVSVIDITFWPLGGMARMSGMPEEPRIEGYVAVAGPAVNFVLAAIFAALAFALEAAGFAAAGPPCFGFAILNLALGSFNLVPAFPLDGGRVLRALLARSTDWVRATEQAVKVGRFIATLMMIAFVVSVFTPLEYGGCAIPMIAAFIWYAGAREVMSVRVRHGQSPFGQSFGARFERQFATNSARSTGEPFEAEHSSSASPESFDTEGAGATRPQTTEPPQISRQGFSEDFVRDLERSRGRLRRPDEDE